MFGAAKQKAGALAIKEKVCMLYKCETLFMCCETNHVHFAPGEQAA